MRYLFPIILISIILVGSIGLYYHADNTNKEYEKNTWYQNGVIIDKYSGFLGDPYCMIQADDNQRYEEFCKLYLIGDKVEIKMQKNYSLSIVKRISQ